MNPDDFEKFLQRQPVKALPKEWRAEILAQAGKATDGQAPAGTDRNAQPWWHDLLWPCPEAWAGLACLWLVILGISLATPAAPPSRVIADLPPNSELIWKALKEERELMAELTGPQPLHAEPPKPRKQGPFSQGRSDTAMA